MAENYHAIAAFGSTAQVYPCLHVDDGADGANVDINSYLTGIFRRFLRPPEWLLPLYYNLNTANELANYRAVKKGDMVP